MIITYCSNVSSSPYQSGRIPVEYGFMPYEDVDPSAYTHVIAQDIGELFPFGCDVTFTPERLGVYGDPSMLVIDLSDGEAFIAVKTPDELAVDSLATDRALHNANIRAQIVALEATQTPRRIREANSANAKIAADGKAWFDELEAEIAALRSQML